MTVSAETYTHTFLICPSCEEETGCRVCHLFGNENWRIFGPWYCGQCGAGFTGSIADDNSVSLTLTGEFHRDGWHLLKIDTSSGPLHAIFKGPWYTDDEQSHARYYYEEHSCMTNWIGDMVECFLGREEDPHGVWKYVRGMIADRDDTHDWLEMFPEIESK